jgi:hypothetical protein
METGGMMHCGGVGVHSDFIHKFEAIITSSEDRIFFL